VPTRARVLPVRRTTGGAIPPLQEPWRSLRETYLLFRRQRANLLVEFDLSFSEYLVLDLCAESPAKASEIAHAVGISPAGATDLIDRLEGRRLVARASHPVDRRAVLVRLTRAGRQLYRDAKSRERANLGRLTALMTDGERRALAVGLAALTRTLGGLGG